MTTHKPHAYRWGFISGLLIGTTLTITIITTTRSRLGKHVLRWVFYKDARKDYPDMYNWAALT